jgi:MYXO-CTERM domain-containing protein
VLSTDADGDGATRSDPIETTVYAPLAGPLSIEERALSQSSPAGIRYLTQEIHVTGDASVAQEPWRISFRIDASRVPLGYREGTIGIYRTGLEVVACDDPAIASPDPCVVSLELLQDGDVRIDLLSSDTGSWNVGVREIACATASDCASDDPCAAESCVQKVCRYALRDAPGCTPECALDSDCDDDDWCTDDACHFGTCERVRMEDDGCQVECVDASDCDDAEACTVDSCDAGYCDHAANLLAPGCSSFDPGSDGPGTGGGDHDGFDDEPYSDDYGEDSQDFVPGSGGDGGFSICSVGSSSPAGTPWSLITLASVAGPLWVRRRRRIG